MESESDIGLLSIVESAVPGIAWEELARDWDP
jgi:hypothetical protein